MEEKILEFMNMIEENTFNCEQHYHVFNKDIEFFWKKNKDINKKGTWSFNLKNDSKITYFNEETVFNTLRSFDIHPSKFYSYLEYLLLNEAVLLKLKIFDREQVFGKNKINEKVKDWEKFSSSLVDVINKTVKQKQPIDTNNVIKIKK